MQQANVLIIEASRMPATAIAPLEREQTASHSKTAQLSEEPIEVFFSYAHTDERLRDELAKHLTGLKRQGIITDWHDRQIVAGAPWEDEIDQHLNSARVILLLISPDFIASNYCIDVEVERAMERHENGDAHVIPVILRPSYWTGMRFGRLNALPKNAKPVTTWPRKDDAFVDVTHGIVKALSALPPSSPPVETRPGIEITSSNKNAADGLKRATITIKADFDSFDATKVSEILALLRRLSGDENLDIKEIKPGSVVLTVECSEEALNRLKELADGADLSEHLGYSVSAVHESTNELSRGEDLAAVDDRSWELERDELLAALDTPEALRLLMVTPRKSEEPPASSARINEAAKQPVTPQEQHEVSRNVGEERARHEKLLAWLRETRRMPVLTASEEVDLAKRIASGDQLAKNILIQANLRLVLKVAQRYSVPAVPLAELIQEGNLGLHQAAEKFDHTRGYRFSTYATWWIRRTILRAIVSKGHNVASTPYTTETIKKLKQASEKLRQLLAHEPTAEELAEEMGISRERLDEIIHLASEPFSLGSPINEIDSLQLVDFIRVAMDIYPSDDPSPSGFRREQLDRALEKLTQNERDVIYMHFGLEDGYPHTLEEVGRRFGMSRERVRLIELRAIKRLRRFGPIDLHDNPNSK